MKSQVTALEFMLNILIVFMLLAYAYLWSTAIFQKTLDRVSINKAQKIIYDLDEKIQRISKSGGKEIFSFEIPGTFELKRNFTSKLYNYIEVRIRTSEVSNTIWVYLNSFNRDKVVSEFTESPSVIRKRKYGNIMYIQLFYRILAPDSEGSTIVIEPRFNWICSGKCQITIEKIGEEDISFQGKVIHAPVVRLDIK